MRSFIFDQQAGETPETIAQKRKIADALASQAVSTAPMQSWTQGLAQVVAALGSKYQSSKANSAETAGREGASSKFNDIVGALYGGNKPAASEPASFGPVDGSKGAQVASMLQKDFGLSPAAAAGFAGNLAHESGNFKTLQEINPTVPGSKGGYGWGQWTGPRRRAFEQYVAQNKLDPTSDEANYGFLKHELTNTPEGAVLARLKGVNDPAQAAQIVAQYYERPGVPHMSSRINYAQQIAGQGGAQNMPFIPGQAGGQRETMPNVPGQRPVDVQQMAGGATVQPAGYSPGAAQQGGQLPMAQIIELMGNPYLNDGQQGILAQIVKQKMAEGQMTEKDMLDLEQARLTNEKLRAEIAQSGRPPKPDYITAKDGSVLEAGPNGIKVVYGSQPDPVKPTSDIQEYEYAKQQGFNGTFADYQMQQKRAGASQVNIDQKAEGAFDKKLAENQANSFDAMATDGMNAKADLAVLGELQGLIAGKGGTFDGLSGALAKYGIGGEGISDIQAAQALINKLVPSQRSPGSGSMSDRDVELFTRSLPSLWNTPGGNQKIMGVMMGLAEYRQAQGDIAQQVMTGQITREAAIAKLRALPNPLAGISGPAKRGPVKVNGYTIEEE